MTNQTGYPVRWARGPRADYRINKGGMTVGHDRTTDRRGGRDSGGREGGCCQRLLIALNGAQRLQNDTSGRKGGLDNIIWEPNTSKVCLSQVYKCNCMCIPISKVGRNTLKGYLQPTVSSCTTSVMHIKRVAKCSGHIMGLHAAVHSIVIGF